MDWFGTAGLVVWVKSGLDCPVAPVGCSAIYVPPCSRHLATPRNYRRTRQGISLAGSYYQVSCGGSELLLPYLAAVTAGECSFAFLPPRWAQHGRYLQVTGSKIFFIRLLQMLCPAVAEQLYVGARKPRSNNSVKRTQCQQQWCSRCRRKGSPIKVLSGSPKFAFKGLPRKPRLRPRRGQKLPPNALQTEVLPQSPRRAAGKTFTHALAQKLPRNCVVSRHSPQRKVT